MPCGIEVGLASTTSTVSEAAVAEARLPFEEVQSMNFFGKVLTVLVAFAAFGLMVASLFVYATHRNWKARLRYSQDATDLLLRLRTMQLAEPERNSLESQLTAEVELYAPGSQPSLPPSAISSCRTNVSLQKQLDQLVQLERTNTAAVASTQANNEKLTAEVGSLREEIRTNQAERDRAFTTTVQDHRRVPSSS